MTDDTRRIRVRTLPPVGEFVSITDPWGTTTKYVVIDWDNDPSGLWEYEHFTPDEGGSELRQQSFTVTLKKLP